MKLLRSPAAYFIFYTLGLQVISAADLDGPAVAVKTETQSPGGTETRVTPSAGTGASPGSPAPNRTSAPGDKVIGSPDEDNSTLTRPGGDKTTEDGARNTSEETTTSINATRASATGSPNATEDKELPPPPPTEVRTVVPGSPTPTTVATTVRATQSSSRGTGYIILFLLIIVIGVFLVIIYLLHKKSKRYSFDLHHKIGEEASIPLNTVDQEGSFQPAIKEDNPGDAEPVQEENVINSITAGAPPNVSTPNGSASETGPTTDPDEENPEKPPSEDSFGSQVPLSPKDNPGTFSLDLNDIDLHHSSHTSEESLGESKNENNNNTGAADTPSRDSAQVDLNMDTPMDETA